LHWFHTYSMTTGVHSDRYHWSHAFRSATGMH
jgi:hypothetical protein